MNGIDIHLISEPSLMQEFSQYEVGRWHGMVHQLKRVQVRGFGRFQGIRAMYRRTAAVATRIFEG